MKDKKVGVLAIQGSFAEHGKILQKMNIDFVWVRDIETLKGITHLIIPGGESTTMTKLLKEFEMWDYLQLAISNNQLSILGTCAGAILISRLFPDAGFTVDRNAYGGQQGSFITKLESADFIDLEGVFIRAPKIILKNNFDQGKVLAKHKETPVLIEGENFLAMSFHPEISGETRLHEYFLEKL